ncbi:unnamed protein product [Rotaria sp. Silwood2]|nr:unnamed protein product [Rotaria sp. Silwood2]
MRLIIIARLAFFNELICRRCNLRLDRSHRSIIAKSIYQTATGLAVFTTKPRSLQKHRFVAVKSAPQPDNIREGRPEIMATKFTTDENRKSRAHELERNDL